MEHADIAISPGRAFGENGEGYFRIALVENEQRLRQAIRNISRYLQEKPIRKAKAIKWSDWTSPVANAGEVRAFLDVHRDRTTEAFRRQTGRSTPLRSLSTACV